MKTATLIGSTGLIGSHILDLLLKDESISSVRILVRRPVELCHPKLEVRVIDFTDLAAFKDGIQGSGAVLCAIGTTNAKVKGDKSAYRKVDFDIPVNAARFCAETGVPAFLLVSSVGANARGGNFYIRLKGEVEEAVGAQKIPSIAIFRPSMLLGRRNESRPMESIAQAITKPLGFLFPSKYKPIRAEDVARSMVAVAKNPAPGFNLFHYREMMKLINPSRT
jgi:uncharacterized protein YbjT (DUF2867 family)